MQKRWYFQLLLNLDNDYFCIKLYFSVKTLNFYSTKKFADQVSSRMFASCLTEMFVPWNMTHQSYNWNFIIIWKKDYLLASTKLRASMNIKNKTTFPISNSLNKNCSWTLTNFFFWWVRATLDLTQVANTTTTAVPQSPNIYQHMMKRPTLLRRSLQLRNKSVVARLSFKRCCSKKRNNLPHQNLRTLTSRRNPKSKCIESCSTTSIISPKTTLLIIPLSMKKMSALASQIIWKKVPPLPVLLPWRRSIGSKRCIVLGEMQETNFIRARRLRLEKDLL